MIKRTRRLEQGKDVGLLRACVIQGAEEAIKGTDRKGRRMSRARMSVCFEPALHQRGNQAKRQSGGVTGGSQGDEGE